MSALPPKADIAGCVPMSALGHFRTHAAQQRCMLDGHGSSSTSKRDDLGKPFLSSQLVGLLRARQSSRDRLIRYRSSLEPSA
jgi:hypothetical protein